MTSKGMDLPPSLMPQLAHAACLNQADDATLDMMMRGNGPLRSDCDEQLIMHFHFAANAPAKVQALLIAAPLDAAAPHHLRFFVNEPTLAFESVDRMRPVEDVALEWRQSEHHSQLRVAHVKLSKLRTHNANHVAAFVMDNTSGGADDITVISDFVLCGELAKGQGTTAAPQRG